MRSRPESKQIGVTHVIESWLCVWARNAPFRPERSLKKPGQGQS